MCSSDLVVNTFAHYPPVELARLIFHELSHQVVYVKDDSVFNESFAVAVEREGVKRWIAQHGSSQDRQTFEQMQKRRADFVSLVTDYRARLDTLYRQRLAPDAMRLEKQRLLAGMRQDYQALRVEWGNFAGYDRWFSEPMSNAHFALISTYHDLVPAFRALLQEKQHLPDFYQAVRLLARADKAQRRLMLERYLLMAQQTYSDISNKTIATQ
mgnify:CR=1 FL=1